jgi:hypothetical protein
MKKNVAGQKIGAQMVSATDGSAFTGAVTVYVTGDAGTQAVGSVGSGACAHEGNGYHTYAPAQAETNYDLIAFTFIGTGAVPVTVQVFTNFPQTGDGYAIVNNGTYGNSAIENLVDDLESRLSATRAGYLDNLSAGAVPTSAGIADAVWDEALSGHLGAGSAGAALNGAGSAGDPWTTSLPGAYGAGTAGNILGNRLAGTIASGTHNPQSGDAFARLGAPAGASVSADIAAVSSSVWAQVMEGSISALQAMRLFLAVLTGKSSNDGKTFRDTGDTKNRLQYTIDGSDNRTSVTRDGS